jgi:hypothetical protein
MSKPSIIIDPQPRTVNLIFDARAQTRLSAGSKPVYVATVHSGVDPTAGSQP